MLDDINHDYNTQQITHFLPNFVTCQFPAGEVGYPYILKTPDPALSYRSVTHLIKGEQYQPPPTYMAMIV